MHIDIPSYKNWIIIYIKFCNSFFPIYGYFSILEVVVSDKILLSLGLSPFKGLNLGDLGTENSGLDS